jgi:hypothetical protein
LIFSVVGSFLILKDPKTGIDLRRSFSLIIPSFIATVLLYASFWAWWGGWSYGYRYLSGILPFFALGLAASINYMLSLKTGNPRKLLAALFSIFLIVSVFVQVVGVFYYPNGDWDSQPDIDKHPEKSWQLNDTQVMRSFNGGLFNPFSVSPKSLDNGT